MRRVKKWRYYCDFCKKGGCSGGHMANHEIHCTKNPNRKCGMCHHVVGDIAHDYKGLAKELDSGWVERYDPTTERMIEGAEEQNQKHQAAIMEKVNNCPACFLTVIRFSTYGAEFDFKKAKENWWNDFSKRRHNDYD